MFFPRQVREPWPNCWSKGLDYSLKKCIEVVTYCHEIGIALSNLLRVVEPSFRSEHMGIMAKYLGVGMCYPSINSNHSLLVVSTTPKLGQSSEYTPRGESIALPK